MKIKNGEHPLGDVGQLVLLIVFLIVWGGDSFFFHRSTFLSHYMPLYVRLALLTIVEVGAIALVRSGHVVVDGGDPAKKIVTSGGFRYVRHPLYLGCLLFYVGLVIATLSLYSLILFGGIFAFYDYIASYEEKFLEEKFPAEYSTYRDKTNKWVPRII
jgi:protein-S-isoprenylcysteine O-methyltransferase Ste14